MRTFVLALACLLPGVAFADDLSSGDTAWMITATALVLFMTLPGLALFYGGLVRTKNVLSVLMQCFAIACVASVVWMVYGYSLAFAEGNAFVGGLGKVFLGGVTRDSMSGAIPESVFVMFQMTFAIITPALVVGAFAERMRFTPMLIFSVLWLTVVYLPVCHWVWASGGWLFERGLLDFAGGTVVHTTCGIAAVVCALVIGRRSGFPSSPMMPHNLTLTAMGAAMLWVGWFGFNAGSAVAANGGAGMAMLVTHISAAAGALAWMAMEWIKYGKPSMLGVATGVIAGLATITPASGFVGPGGALIIGLLAGVVCWAATSFLKQKLHIDDSLDVFPVHGVGGMMGTLLAAIFASDSLGVFSGHGYNEGMTMGSQFGVQVIGVVAVAAYTGILTLVLLKIIGVVSPLRATEEEETAGLDQSQHNEKGYNL